MKKWLLPLLLSTVLHANAPGRGKHYYSIDAGAHGTYLDDRISAPSGFATEVSVISGYLRFRPGFHLGKNFYFEPSFGLVLPWQSSADGNTRSFPGHLDFTLNAPIFKFIRGRIGTGAYLFATAGDGGAVTLNNGGSNLTSTYATPASMRVSINLTVNASLELVFSKHFSLTADLYALEVASPTRRRFHGSLQIGYTL